MGYELSMTESDVGTSSIVSSLSSLLPLAAAIPVSNDQADDDDKKERDHAKDDGRGPDNRNSFLFHQHCFGGQV